MKLRNGAGALLATGALLFFASCDNGPGAKTTTSSSGAGGGAADFSTVDTEGRPFKLSSHLGKDVILLNFCATWCEPCVAEFPHLRKLYADNKGKGFLILAISVDGPETVANIPAFAKRNQLNFPVVTDEDSRIASLYNPKKSAPLSVLIDRQGKIVSIREGYNPGDEEFLAQDIAKVLDGASASK